MDIQNKLIRMNGNPEKRLKEDLLRIMRVYRFSSTLGFQIDKKTLISCRKNFNEMKSKIPAERIKNEIEKMAIICAGEQEHRHEVLCRIEKMVGI